ncbi:MAG: GNAT family N-acetyltransferase, partial [Candidatus Omnitrophica bacterium]|nr:GNAT family N-acetyltransferase [Candidatus Omnitrophota bacterium]
GIAYSKWAIENIKLRLRKGAILLHIDRHSDMFVNDILNNEPISVDEAERCIYPLASFIPPAVFYGLVSDIYWVVPYDMPVGEDEKILVEREDFSNGPSRYHAEVFSLDEAERVILNKGAELKQALVHTLHLCQLPFFITKNKLILDIDIDFFAPQKDIKKTELKKQVREEIDALGSKVRYPAVITLALSTDFTGREFVGPIAIEVIESLINCYDEGDSSHVNGRGILEVKGGDACDEKNKDGGKDVGLKYIKLHQLIMLRVDLWAGMFAQNEKALNYAFIALELDRTCSKIYLNLANTLYFFNKINFNRKEISDENHYLIKILEYFILVINAVDNFTKVIKLYPDFGWAYLFGFVAYLSKGNFDFDLMETKKIAKNYKDSEFLTAIEEVMSERNCSADGGRIGEVSNKNVKIIKEYNEQFIENLLFECENIARNLAKIELLTAGPFKGPKMARKFKRQAKSMKKGRDEWKNIFLKIQNKMMDVALNEGVELFEDKEIHINRLGKDMVNSILFYFPEYSEKIYRDVQIEAEEYVNITISFYLKIFMAYGDNYQGLIKNGFENKEEHSKYLEESFKIHLLLYEKVEDAVGNNFEVQVFNRFLDYIKDYNEQVHNDIFSENEGDDSWDSEEDKSDGGMSPVLEQNIGLRYKYYNIGNGYRVVVTVHLRNKVGFNIYKDDLYKDPYCFNNHNYRIGYGWVNDLEDFSSIFRFRIMKDYLCEDSEYILMQVIELIKRDIFKEIKTFFVPPDQIEADWLVSESNEYSPMRTLVFYIRKFYARFKYEDVVRKQLGLNEFNRLIRVIKGESEQRLTREDVSKLSPGFSLMILYEEVYERKIKVFQDKDGGLSQKQVFRDQICCQGYDSTNEAVNILSKWHPIKISGVIIKNRNDCSLREKELLSKLVRDSLKHDVWAAFKNGRIIGFIIVNVKEASITSIEVIRHYQNNGVARYLLRAVFLEFARQGVKNIKSSAILPESLQKWHYLIKDRKFIVENKGWKYLNFELTPKSAQKIVGEQNKDKDGGDIKTEIVRQDSQFEIREIIEEEINNRIRLSQEAKSILIKNDHIYKALSKSDIDLDKVKRVRLNFISQGPKYQVYSFIINFDDPGELKSWVLNISSFDEEIKKFDYNFARHNRMGKSLFNQFPENIPEQFGYDGPVNIENRIEGKGLADSLSRIQVKSFAELISKIWKFTGMAYKYIPFNVIQSEGGKIILTDFYKTLSAVTPFEFFYEYSDLINRFPDDFFEGVCLGLTEEKGVNDFLINFLKISKYDNDKHLSIYINEIDDVLNKILKKRNEGTLSFFHDQGISDGGKKCLLKEVFDVENTIVIMEREYSATSSFSLAECIAIFYIGPCVGLILYDRALRIGLMAHFDKGYTDYIVEGIENSLFNKGIIVSDTHKDVYGDNIIRHILLDTRSGDVFNLKSGIPFNYKNLNKLIELHNDFKIKVSDDERGVIASRDIPLKVGQFSDVKIIKALGGLAEDSRFNKNFMEKFMIRTEQDLLLVLKAFDNNKGLFGLKEYYPFFGELEFENKGHSYGPQKSDGGVNIDQVKPYLFVSFSQVNESKVLNQVYGDGVIVPRTFLDKEKFIFLKEEIEANLKEIDQWKNGNLNKKIDIFYSVLVKIIKRERIRLPCCDLASWLTKDIFKKEGYLVDFRYAVYMKTADPFVFWTVQIEDKDTGIKYLFDPMIIYTRQIHYETFLAELEQKDGGIIEKNIEEVRKKQLTKEFYHNYDDILGENGWADPEGFDGIIKSFLWEKNNCVWADIGCGLGIELNRFKQNYPDLRVYGIDLIDWRKEEPFFMFEDMFRYKFGDKIFYNKNSYYFIQENAENIFLPEKVDLITAFMLVFHLKFPDIAINNWFNHLKEGGVLIINFLPETKNKYKLIFESLIVKGAEIFYYMDLVVIVKGLDKFVNIRDDFKFQRGKEYSFMKSDSKTFLDGGNSEVKETLQKKGFSLIETEIIKHEVNYIIDKLKLKISPEEKEKIILKFKPYRLLDFIGNNKLFFIYKYIWFLPYIFLGVFIRVEYLNKEINVIRVAVLFLIALFATFIGGKYEYKQYSGDLSSGRGEHLKNLEGVDILCKSGVDIDLFREAVVHELTHYLGTAGYIKIDLYLATAFGEYRMRELNKETEFSLSYEKYYFKGFELGDETDIFLREKNAKDFC